MIKYIDELISEIEDASPTKGDPDNMIMIELTSNERDLLIDALVLYKEMNTR